MPEESRKSFSERRKERRAAAAKMGEIPALYAFLIEDDGDEGVVVGQSNRGYHPLVTTRRSQLKMMGELAKEAADGLQRPVQIVTFVRGRVIGKIEPAPLSESEAALVAASQDDEQAEGLKIPESMPGAVFCKGGLSVYVEGDLVMFSAESDDGKIRTMGFPPATAMALGEAMVAGAITLMVTNQMESEPEEADV